MWKKIFKLYTVFCLAIFFLGLTAVANGQTAADEYVNNGEDALFLETVDGILQAHSIFQEAQAACPNDPVINAYLAMTRLLHLALTEDPGGLMDFLSQFGVYRTGNDLDTLELEGPTLTKGEYDECLLFPETAPSGEAVRSFLAGPLLTALNASIANLDTTINVWGDSDKHIIPATKIKDQDLDIKFDHGDIFLFRAGLKTLKSFILIITAYDLDVSIRELAALGQIGALNPKYLLEKYPDFLNLLSQDSAPSVDGGSQLSEARTALVEAIDDYLTASIKIRNDPRTESGAEELIEIDECDLQDEEFFRNELTKIKKNLTDPSSPVIEFVDQVEYWIFTDDATEDSLEVHLWDNMSDGDCYGMYGCNFICCGGGIDCVIISGDQITLEMDGVTFTGTLDTEMGEITGGSYTGWTSGTFTAKRTNVIIEDIDSVDLNPLFGTGSSPKTGPYNLRDFLPQFNECGIPIVGTMGHGLNNDPTLGGIAPDQTQNDWDLEGGASCGTVEIPTVEPTDITLDGDLSDWTDIAPVYTDVSGNNDPNLPGTDIKDFYLAKDDQYLYLAMTLHDGPPSQDVMYWFVAAERCDEWDRWGELSTQAYYDSVNGWAAEVIRRGDWQTIGYHPGSAASGSDTIEWKVPLSEMDNLSGRFIRIYTHAYGYYDPSEDHLTCLQILPCTSITCTLSVPDYNDTGAIYIGVFQYDGSCNIDWKNAYSTYIIYPGEYTPDMPPYTIENLPVDEEVCIGVWWDSDFNGVETSGDYLGTSDPVITVTTPVTVDLVADQEVSPFSIEGSVMNVHEADGSLSTCFEVLIGNDYTGILPDGIHAITITAPSGALSYTKDNFEYLPQRRVFFHKVPGSPEIGVYTFTVETGGSTVTDTFTVNSPPDTPTALSPADEATLEEGTVTLSTSEFSDPDSDTHTESHWLVRRADSVYYRSDYDESFNTTVVAPDDLTHHEVSGLSSGMKYVWKVGYTDSGSGEISWSEEYSFKIGASEADSSVEIDSGTEEADFKMVSFVQWPDNPTSSSVFDITYDKKYFRIGTYDPTNGSGGYVEYGSSLKIEPGKSYWFLARDGLPITVNGIPVSLTDDIEIKLLYNSSNGNGWNMIGCPNAANYNWDDVQVIEYNPNDGSIVFGPAAITELDDPNAYIDKRLWRWESGAYYSDTTLMEKHEGYWVKAKKPNLFLRFRESVQTASISNPQNMFARFLSKGKRWMKKWIFTPQVAIADSDDSPPRPMGDFSAVSPESVGGCFIATATYGSPMERHVKILRNFRDAYLLNSTIGHMFVKAYYRYSPPVADFIAKHKTVKVAVRMALLPLVAFSYAALHLGLAVTLYGILLIFMPLIFLVLVYKRRKV